MKKALNIILIALLTLTVIGILAGAVYVAIGYINDGGETQFGWSGTQTLPIAEDAAEKFCKGQNILIWHYE